MKKCVLVAMALAFAAESFAQDGRVLVAYFSKGGNTEKVAQEIAAETGGTLARIFAREPYPVEKQANMERAKDEYRRGARPEIECEAADVSGYDVVFIGYPLWCGHAPAPLLTFLEAHDFSGKTVVPFVTYGGSPFARGTDEVRKSAPNAAFGKTIAVRASRVPQCAGKVRSAARNAVDATRREKPPLRK